MSWDFIQAHSALLWELAGVFAFLTLVILAGGMLLARFDGLPFGEAIYLAFVTALTVGFGDLTPRSGAARVVTVVLAFFGMLLFGILIATAVHAMDEALLSR